VSPIPNRNLELTWRCGDIKQESGSEHNVVGQCRSLCEISQCQSLWVKMVYDLAHVLMLWGQQERGLAHMRPVTL
jgi:hypothetical protein